jgi:predicted transcriptional regulator
VSEIINRGIITANINDSVKRVAEIMRQEEIGAVPILEKNHPVGFVTDRDIVIECVAEGYSMNKPISHAMNEDVICVRENQDVVEATRLMEDRQVSRVLVIDDLGCPVGIVSLKELYESNE